MDLCTTLRVGDKVAVGGFSVGKGVAVEMFDMDRCYRDHRWKTIMIVVDPFSFASRRALAIPLEAAACRDPRGRADPARADAFAKQPRGSIVGPSGRKIRGARPGRLGVSLNENNCFKGLSPHPQNTRCPTQNINLQKGPMMIEMPGNLLAIGSRGSVELCARCGSLQQRGLVSCERCHRVDGLTVSTAPVPLPDSVLGLSWMLRTNGFDLCVKRRAITGFASS